MLIRTVIVVPTYNHNETVSHVVEDCLAKTELPVYVIDDGSAPKAESVLKPNPRLRIFTLARNSGKGFALQIAFKEALKEGYTHLLSIDADGQHPVEEISKLLAASEQSPMSLIIGMRDLSGTTVPEMSRFGRKFSNFWVNYETGTQVNDSQSGLRVYPLFPLQMMKFRCKRYDFEIEVLIRLIWKGMKVVEVPVLCHYAEKEKRISHFNKIRDNIRISFLNTLLVVTSLFRQNLSPLKSSTAIALGVLIGTTPFFGFHTPLVILFSLFLPLNLGLLFLGTQVSIPPLAPLIAVGSIRIGQNLIPSDVPIALPIEVSEAKLFFSQWLSGSLVLGTVLGVLAFLLTYSIFKVKAELKPDPKAWTGKSRGGKFGNWFLLQVLKLFGFRAAYFCLYFIVPYFFIFAPKATYASLQYWKAVLPDAGFLKRSGLVLKHYFEFGKVMLDQKGFEILTKFDVQPESHGFENIQTLVKNKQGVILLGAHVGSWETASKRIRSDWKLNQFHSIQYGANRVPADKKKTPEQIIYHNRTQHASLDIQNLLKEGNPVGMMADRPSNSRYELVPFMGKLLPIDVSPFRIALALDVPLIFTFGFRKAFKKYSFYASSPYTLVLTEKEKEQEIYESASLFAKSLEAHVKENPYQWFNFFPVFSFPPA